MSPQATPGIRAEAGRTPKTEAAYLRIARMLSDRIHDGEYQPGGQLPTERQFAKEFGVSLMTLRRAMQVLEERGPHFVAARARDLRPFARAGSGGVRTAPVE